MKPALPWYHSQLRILQEKKTKPISLMNIDTHILSKILASQIQQHIKRIVHHDQINVTYPLECKNGSTSVTQSMWYTTLIDWNIKIIGSFQHRKSIWCNSITFHDKNSQQIGIEVMYLNIIKALFKEPQLIYLVMIDWNSHYIKVKHKTGLSILTTLIQRSTGSLSWRNEARKTNKLSRLERQK